MTNEKLKRISLGGVVFMILIVLLILLWKVIIDSGIWSAQIRQVPWAGGLAIAGSFLVTAFIMILGLYLIAKIIIEIFK
jgi:hypothetical protein